MFTYHETTHSDPNYRQEIQNFCGNQHSNRLVHTTELSRLLKKATLPGEIKLVEFFRLNKEKFSFSVFIYVAPLLIC